MSFGVVPSLGVSSLDLGRPSGRPLFRMRDVPGCAAIVIGCSSRLKKTDMDEPVLSLAEDAAMLALDAQTVIGIRLAQFSCGGPAAGIEAQRMVSEKVSAFVEAAALLATGGSVHDVVKGYRGHVQANVRRLTA